MKAPLLDAEQPAGSEHKKTRRYDKIGGVILMGGLVCYSVLVVFKWVVILSFALLSEELHAYQVLRLTNDSSQLYVYALTFALWHALSQAPLTGESTRRVFRWRQQLHEAMRTGWTRQWAVFGSNQLMSFGFAPQVATLSVGFLLFVKGVLVKTDGCLPWSDAMKTYDGCRADTVEINDFAAHWFSRLWRTWPTGCYGWQTGFDFGKEFYLDAGFNMSAVANGPHPLEGDKLRADLTCTYECASWIPLSFLNFVNNCALIFAGVAAIARLTGAWSQFCGPKLITKDTSPNEFTRLVQRTARLHLPSCLQGVIPKRHEDGEAERHGDRGSWTRCAVVVLALLYGTSRLAVKLDSDGQFTPDFYVGWALLFSASFAIMLRYVNPYLGEAMLFTQPLWAQGEDTFPVWRDDGFQEEKVTLYDWMHRRRSERTESLLLYTMTVDDDEIKAWKGDSAKSEHDVKFLSGRDIPIETTIIDDDGGLVMSRKGFVHVYACASATWHPEDQGDDDVQVRVRLGEARVRLGRGLVPVDAQRHLFLAGRIREDEGAGQYLLVPIQAAWVAEIGANWAGGIREEPGYELIRPCVEGLLAKIQSLPCKEPAP